MKNFLILLSLISVLPAKAQVNGYAKVSLIAGPVLTVTNSNETYDQFDIGDKVIVMQMQDDVIGSNTSNNSNFGNLSSINNAGKYEVATVLAVVRTGILPTVITLTAPLTNPYNVGANSSVQIITFPTLGTTNFTTNADITAVPWNGNVGGVVAFNVEGVLRLRHSVTADNAGFRGGVADQSTNPYGSCNYTNYYSPVHPFYGNKGEGIYKTTNANHAAGMGKMLNGAGGGNTINSGGGGGGNYTTGGNGFYGWNCSNGTGGIGGISLATHISGNRFFLGGGGGSGEANDNANNRGGAGGGIVIIKANTLRTTGTGTGIRISANGEAALTIANDGAGGGGAGGSVMLDVNTFDISNNNRITIAANGGNGGNVGVNSQHGGGGGGGQGAVIFRGPIPNTTSITLNTSNGTGGLNWTGSGATRAANGGGSNNVGIITTSATALPLKLIAFNGSQNSNGITLNWKTTNEENVSHFSIERSVNGSLYEPIGNVKARGNSNSTENYSFNDGRVPSVTTYYRLKMIDIDGKFIYSHVLVIRPLNENKAGLDLFPNPVSSSTTLFVRADNNGTAIIRVMNVQGATVMQLNNAVTKGENAISLKRPASMTPGMYSVQAVVNGKTYVTRMLVQ